LPCSCWQTPAASLPGKERIGGRTIGSGFLTNGLGLVTHDSVFLITTTFALNAGL